MVYVLVENLAELRDIDLAAKMAGEKVSRMGLQSVL